MYTLKCCKQNSFLKRIAHFLWCTLQVLLMKSPDVSLRGPLSLDFSLTDHLNHWQPITNAWEKTARCMIWTVTNKEKCVFFNIISIMEILRRVKYMKDNLNDSESVFFLFVLFFSQSQGNTFRNSWSHLFKYFGYTRFIIAGGLTSCPTFWTHMTPGGWMGAFSTPCFPYFSP